MKKLIVAAILTSFATPAFADCDLAKDIIVLPNNVQYSFDCHKLVGKTFADNEDRKQEIKLLKDLAIAQNEQIALAEQKAELWEKTSLDLKKDKDKIEKYQTYENYGFFGLGLLTSVLMTYLITSASK